MSSIIYSGSRLITGDVLHNLTDASSFDNGELFPGPSAVPLSSLPPTTRSVIESNDDGGGGDDGGGDDDDALQCLPA